MRELALHIVEFQYWDVNQSTTVYIRPFFLCMLLLIIDLTVERMRLAENQIFYQIMKVKIKVDQLGVKLKKVEIFLQM